MAKIKTQPIRKEDRDEFLDAVVPYLQELSPGWQPTPEWRDTYFEELSSESTRWLWWAVDEAGDRVGFANFAAVQDLRDPTAWIGELAEFTIFPEHRRAGVGRALAQAVIAQLEDFGVRSIEVIVRAGMEDGLAFWRAMGFAPAATVLRRDQVPS